MFWPKNILLQQTSAKFIRCATQLKGSLGLCDSRDITHKLQQSHTCSMCKFSRLLNVKRSALHNETQDAANMNYNYLSMQANALNTRFCNWSINNGGYCQKNSSCWSFRVSHTLSERKTIKLPFPVILEKKVNLGFGIYIYKVKLF